MTDTVFIFGAGFSYDAGIPLLSGFVDRMLDFAIKEKNSDQLLSPADIEIFKDAMKIRNELDGYHGRANFDDRNIEDLLSILTFKLLGSRSSENDQLARISAAIARTIELTCQIKHPGINKVGLYSEDDSINIYKKFWRHLLSPMPNSEKLPAIITFNYDLVLERSFHQLLIGTFFNWHNNRFPHEKIRFNYNFSDVPIIDYEISYVNFSTPSLVGKPGSIIQPAAIKNETSTIEIDLLKLHGSLNFPRKKENRKDSVTFAHGITTPLNSPFILPPVFNKMTSGNSTTSMWQAAMKKLGNAKNIVIVGYSLPKTDIYMQYFLKAALGPNKNLNKVFIFDPVLFQENKARDEMMDRYKSCFAENFINRIVFQPDTVNIHRTDRLGTTRYFVELLENNQGGLLF